MSSRANNWGYIVLALFFPLALFIFLLWQHILPQGVYRVSYIPGKQAARIGSLLPAERIDTSCQDSRGVCVTMTQDPVYLFVQPPTTDMKYVQAKIFFDPGDQSVMEFGPMVDVFLQRFDLQGIAHRFLSSVPWDSVTQNAQGMAVGHYGKLFRDTDSTGLEIFSASEVMTYKTPLKTRPDIDGLPANSETFFPQLIGAHEGYMIGAPAAEMSCVISDDNIVPGDDSGVMLFRERSSQQVIASTAFDDNVQERPYTLRADQAEDISFVFTATSDIRWDQCQVQARGVVVKNVVRLGRAEPFRLWTNAHSVTIRARNAQGVQNVRASTGQVLSVAFVGEKYSIAVTNEGEGAGWIDFSSGDVEVVGAGVFAFSSDMLFAPDPGVVPTQRTFSENDARTNILATFAPTQQQDGWTVATLAFPLEDVDLEKGAVRFALSAPGVDGVTQQPKIHRIEITFTRDPLSWRGIVREVWYLVKNIL
jgi:hypothetical protein